MSFPEIRIKKFSEQWIESTFSDVFEILKSNSLSRAELSNKGTVYNIHYGDVLINYDECLTIDKRTNIPFIKDQELGIKLHQSSSLKNGDIVFADAAEDNTVGKCTEVISSDKDAIVAGLHTIPCRPKSNFASGYLGFFLNSDAFHNQLLGIIQGTKVSSISKKSIKNTKVKYPSCIEEQESISRYMQVINMLLNKVQGKIDSLKQIKSACLQSMFPQEGESVPKVRFKGFEDNWSAVTVSDVLIERREMSKKTKQFPLMAFVAYKGVCPKGDRYDRSALVNDEENKLYKKTYLGDFIYSSNNLETGSIGLNNYGNATISPVYSIFHCLPTATYSFVGYYMVRKQFINEMVKWRQGVMYGQWRIHEADFLQIKISLPSLNEQIKIGEFFVNLDKQISLQTQRLEKLKQIKSACLDKMFV